MESRCTWCDRHLFSGAKGQYAHAGRPSRYLGFSAPGSQLPLSCASAFTLMHTREPLLLNGLGSCGRAATPLTKEDFSMVAFMAAVPASWDCSLAPAALDVIALHAIRLRFGDRAFPGFRPFWLQSFSAYRRWL